MSAEGAKKLMYKIAERKVCRSCCVISSMDCHEFHQDALRELTAIYHLCEKSKDCDSVYKQLSKSISSGDLDAACADKSAKGSKSQKVTHVAVHVISNFLSFICSGKIARHHCTISTTPSE